MILQYLLILFVLLIFVQITRKKEGFIVETLLDIASPPSPIKVIEGLHSKFKHLIPYKNQYNKIKRHLRFR